MTNDQKQDVLDFISKMNQKYGNLPKSCHNMGEFKDRIFYGGPNFDSGELLAGVGNFLFGKWLSSGEAVHEFELNFSKKFNNRFSLMVNSGSSANLIMVAATKKHLNWKNDDEIIVSPVGFPTTISAILINNLKPIFIDIEYDTLNFDVSLIESKITNKTKCIFVSPVLGNPPDFDKLLDICKKYNLVLLLDNCDSLGSKWNNKYLNEYSIASSCSFFPSHHITSGEGGMISTNNNEIINIARSMVNWGRKCYCLGADNLLTNGTCGARFARWIPGQDYILDHKYVYGEMGFNLKPIDLQGAIGVEQLKKFDKFAEDRRNNYTIIKNLFDKHVKGIKFVSILDKADPCWFGLPIIVDNNKNKTKLVKYLEINSVQTRNYFSGNILLHDAYKYLESYLNYPLSNLVLNNVFFVGVSPTYTEKHIAYIEKVLSGYES